MSPKRQPWVIEQKELETKGIKFNESGEIIKDEPKKVQVEEPVKNKVKKGLGNYIKKKLVKSSKNKKRGK